MTLLRPPQAAACLRVAPPNPRQDISHLDAFANHCPEPDLAQELSAPRQLCSLLLSHSVRRVPSVCVRECGCPCGCQCMRVSVRRLCLLLARLSTGAFIDVLLW